MVNIRKVLYSMLLIWQLYSLLSHGVTSLAHTVRPYGTNITAWAALSFIANENLLLLDVSDNCSCIVSIQSSQGNPGGDLGYRLAGAGEA